MDRLFAAQRLHSPAHGLQVRVPEGTGRGGSISHGNSNGAPLTLNRQIHRVRHAAFPDLKLPLRPEPLVLQRDEQAVSAGGIEIVDLLGGGESVPGAFDE